MILKEMIKKMGSTKKWVEILERTVPLYRHICSPGLDECIHILSEYFDGLETHSYKTGSTCWTWDIPRKWVIKEGWIKRDGVKLIDFKDNELCVVTGSCSISKNMKFQELESYLFFNKDIPELTSWEFVYFKENVWGFSIPYNFYKELLEQESKKQSDYEVYIDSTYYDDSFNTASVLLQGYSNDIIVISSDICHPKQANDSMSGVAVAYILYQYLKTKKDRWFSYLFLFQPEFIGTVAFFSNHENLIDNIKYGIYTEIVGSDGPIVLQKSFTGCSAIDAAAIDVLLENVQDNCVIKQFMQYGICNDEVVLSMPGLRIPSIAINRGAYREYHSDADTLENLKLDNIESAADIIIKIVKKMESRRPVRREIEYLDRSLSMTPNRYSNQNSDKNYIPIPKFKGVIFLTKYKLYVNYKINYKLAVSTHKIMILINGINPCSSIAYACGLDEEEVIEFIDKLFDVGLISKKKIT